MMSNFDQMATAKECMQVLVSRAQKRVPCRKQISSGNTQERRFFGLQRRSRRGQATSV